MKGSIGRVLVIGLVSGAMALGSVSMVAAAAPATVQAAVGVAAQAPPAVRPYVMGPLGVLAKLAGVKVEDVMTQRQGGKSLADIAKSKGVSTDKLLDEVLAARKAFLDVRVKQGVITQKQADEILEFQRERMKQRFQDATVGGRLGGRGRGAAGPGGCDGSGRGRGAGAGLGGAGGIGSGQGGITGRVTPGGTVEQ